MRQFPLILVPSFHITSSLIYFAGSKVSLLTTNYKDLVAQQQSCKNVPTVPTSWCYFFWPVLIFGKSTQKTGENTRKQAKTRKNRRKTGAFLVLIFLGEKLVGANFYAFCNYDCLSHQRSVKIVVVIFSMFAKQWPTSLLNIVFCERGSVEALTTAIPPHISAM